MRWRLFDLSAALRLPGFTSNLIPSHLYVAQSIYTRRSFDLLLMSMFGDDDIFDDIPVDHRSCRLLGPTALVSRFRVS